MKFPLFYFWFWSCFKIFIPPLSVYLRDKTMDDKLIYFKIMINEFFRLRLLVEMFWHFWPLQLNYFFYKSSQSVFNQRMLNKNNNIVCLIFFLSWTVSCVLLTIQSSKSIVKHKDQGSKPQKIEIAALSLLFETTRFFIFYVTYNYTFNSMLTYSWYFFSA